jgi:hypothetical protein
MGGKIAMIIILFGSFILMFKFIFWIVDMFDGD